MAKGTFVTAAGENGSDQPQQAPKDTVTRLIDAVTKSVSLPAEDAENKGARKYACKVVSRLTGNVGRDLWTCSEVVASYVMRVGVAKGGIDFFFFYIYFSHTHTHTTHLPLRPPFFFQSQVRA